MRREIIDVHTHCFANRRLSGEIAENLDTLRAAGLAHMVVVGLINTKLDEEAIWSFIPREVENRGDPLFYEIDELLGLAADHAPTILPFVDTRHLWGTPTPMLQGCLDRGFRGIKGIYLADDGNDLGVKGIPDTFGITLREYQRREWEIFSFAEARGLPIVYHMDARSYGDVMRALLDDFPRVRVDFAHFGISRKAFREILERYPNVWTDLASMLPHVRKDPQGYRDFILAYPDRVCFASDAFLHFEPQYALDYVRMVDEMRLPEEVERMVLSENPRRFLGAAAP